MSTLEQLRQFTTIVSDTADFEKLGHYQPQDGTTNPSHILNAVKLQKYTQAISAAASYGIPQSRDLETRVQHAILHLIVSFGVEILKRIPGCVSTEVDATYSFDRDRTIAMAGDVVGLYEKFGVCRDRVLIGITSTWEGLQACQVPGQEGIHCTMTAMFSMVQAKLAAEVEASVISPFVGRTIDWWQKYFPGKDYTGLKDPGVQLVTKIFHHYKSLGIKTQIMAASLRNIGECVHLAGVDLMTINVGLLEELKNADYEVKARLLVANGELKAHKASPEYLQDEAKFRLDLFTDVMATEKINESLRIFFNDGEELKKLLRLAIISQIGPGQNGHHKSDLM
ncbi:uncharacterized protein A1O5_05738 [Cladophialophora psammophila CBS 110553]|uniref:transaldolase n=1 Tax=Cladophialophora psammophila CBS 110553 TaxID=1182543 RepID=W9WS37_9EURO|nr:uncharacterized protein A1O5_05738 [Cladophialophora psammophila CBS 110553]EXJ70748.1 hypothetical protein A1O5_05738 [Cladophialophora psammophila CBS 110553]